MMAGENIRLLRSMPDALGGQPRYEIRHDRLAPAILDWEARYQDSRDRIAVEEQLERQRADSAAKIHAARRRTRLAVATGSLVSLVAVGAIAFAFVFLNQARELETQRLQEASSKHVIAAQSALAIDPQLALGHALEAWDTSHTLAAQGAVRLALSNSRLKAVVKGHSGGLETANFSPDGSLVVTAGDDHTARVADANTGATLRVLRGHTDAVTEAIFTPDSSRVVTTSLDGTARVWNAETGEQLYVLEHDAPVRMTMSDAVAADGAYVATGPLTADGSRLVTFTDKAAWVWDLTTRTLIRQLRTDATMTYSAAFSNDASRIVTADDGGFARIWDARSGTLLHSLDNLTDWVQMATFSPDGAVVAAANSDGSIGIWNAETGDSVDFQQSHTNLAIWVAFSSNGLFLLSAGDTRVVIYTVSVKNVENAAPVITVSQTAEVRPNASWVNSARFSPDASWILTAHQDGTARVSEARTGKELMALRGHRSVVWTAAFSGCRIVTASETEPHRASSSDTGVFKRENARHQQRCV